MKIHQLPDGARFLYEGEEYVKSGPMFGTGKQGQKLIPKYAVLQPLDAPAGMPEATTALVARPTVARAFAAFYAECQRLLPPEQRTALERARERFLKALG